MTTDKGEYQDHSAAIAKGVENWLDKNSDIVLEVLHNAGDSGIEKIAGVIMLEIRNFFEQNRADLITAFVTAMTQKQQEISIDKAGEENVLEGKDSPADRLG